MATRDESGPPLSYALTRLSRQIGRSLSNLTAGSATAGVAAGEHELAGPQIAALLALDQDAGLSSAELARRSLVSAQSMNEVVLELERRKLLVRAADPANARILRSTLTPAGRKAVRAWRKRIAALEAQLLEGLTPAQAREFRATIDKCARNLGAPSS